MTKNTERPIAPSGFRPAIAPGDGPGFDTAEYATPDRSRLESGFYVTDRGLPWHVTLARRMDLPELMEGMDRKLTVGEALVMAGCDWPVVTAPVFAKVGKKHIEVPGRKVTLRSDTNAILSPATVSESYKVVQNADAFAFADHILEVPGAHCESGGSLFGGRVVFLSMELPDDIHVEGDPSDYRLFLLISNGHDGNHKLRVDVTAERTLCRNTLRIAQQKAIQSWSIRHTSGIDGRVQEARNALALTHRWAEDFNVTASALVQTKLVDRQVDDILARLFPLTEAQQERIDKDPTKMEKVPLGVVRTVYQESPTVAPVKGTAWGVLSAVTEYADHFRTYQKVGSGSSEENRAEHLMFDEGGNDIKQRAWSMLTADVKPRKGA